MLHGELKTLFNAELREGRSASAALLGEHSLDIPDRKILVREECDHRELAPVEGVTNRFRQLMDGVSASCVDSVRIF